MITKENFRSNIIFLHHKYFCIIKNGFVETKSSPDRETTPQMAEHVFSSPAGLDHLLPLQNTSLCLKVLHYSTIATLLEKYPNFFFCEKLVNFNGGRLHEATLNLHTHTWFFPSIESVNGKQHLSEVVFSALIGFSLYITSTQDRVNNHQRVLQGCSPSPTCGARDRSCGQQAIDASITTMLEHILRTWFRLFFFCKKTRLLWFARLVTQLIWLPATSGCSPNSRGHWKESDFRQERTLWLQRQPS